VPEESTVAGGEAPRSLVKMTGCPPLRSDAELVPGPGGLLIGGNSDVELIALALPTARQALLLDMLANGADPAGICAATGLDPQQFQTLVDQLAARGLLAADPPLRTPIEPMTYFGEAGSISTPGEPPPEVLLVGLGELGLALLRDLLRFGHFRVHLCDPTVVAPIDILPFYRVGELAQNKAQVVADWLRAVAPTRVRAHVPRDLTVEDTERELTAAIGEIDVVICCLDQPGEISQRLTLECSLRGVALVVAQLTRRGGVIDPVLAGARLCHTQGCTGCAALYRAATDPFAASLPAYLSPRFPRVAHWRYAHPLGRVEALAALTALAVRRAFDIRAGRRPVDDKVTQVDFDQWAVNTAPVPRHFACRICYPGRPSSAASRVRMRLDAPPTALPAVAARLRPLGRAPYGIFQPGMRRGPRERQVIFRCFRQRGVEPLGNRLANADHAVSIRRVVDGPHVTSQLGEYLDLGQPGHAEAIAMIEGLERLFTLDYCAPERIVVGAYADLQARALDPRRLPLYADEQYRDPAFPFRRFVPEKPMQWIEGVTLTDNRPVLVPLDFVRAAPAGGLYHATSNGAACHSSLAQAIVNAICETVERDAFMIAWLNQLSLPGIEITAADPDPWELRDTFRRLGFELALVDLTMDLQIPVMLGVLRDRHNPDFLLTNMVSALDPLRALGKLCRELAQFAYGYLLDLWNLNPAVTRAAHPDCVATFPDHLAFYQSREKHRHAAFLTQAPRSRRLGEGPYEAGVADARRELELLAARLRERGHDIIVVDCTVPFVAELGLHVVKVVIPGLQPLNAGHRRRVLGGTRLYETPVRLGLSARARALTELNPWPHPFW
jgi:thiazole/oxazole-forming peptide maturase SagD family component